MSVRRTIAPFVCGALVLLLSGAPSKASAEPLRPWWGLTSAAEPTNATGVNEIQHLTVSATAGEFALINPATFEFRFFSWNASASDIAHGLEEIYKSPVVVEGGPGDETGSSPYTITFPSQSAELIAFGESNVLESSRTSLSGGKAEATSSEVQHGHPAELVVTAENLGDVSTSSPVEITDLLPAHFTPLGEPRWHAGGTGSESLGDGTCSSSPIVCTFSGSLPPFEEIEVRIPVIAGAGASAGAINSASVSGGGALAPRNVRSAIPLGEETLFGFEHYDLTPEEAGGTSDARAGSHPFQLTSTVDFNNRGVDVHGRPRAIGLVKTVAAELPPGFIGNPTPFSQCTDQEFANSLEAPNGVVYNECPPSSAVGVVSVSFTDPQTNEFHNLSAPIFNMTPLPGEPARFGFKALGIISAYLDASVRTGADYGVTITSSNITELASLLSVKLTFWGVPGDVRHNGQRGWECLKTFGSCPEAAEASPPPFLIMPTACEAPPATTIHGETWATPTSGTAFAERTFTLPLSIDGCDRLPFSPEVRVTPDGTAGSTPTGLNVDVHVPQTAILDSESLAESAVRNIQVALPEGVAVNPAGGDGLAGCGEGLVGFTGFDPAQPETAMFTATPKPPFESPEPGLNTCANASKIGEVTIHSPLLPPTQPLKGFVYLATQNQNPFGSLIALYIVAEDPVSGTLIKQAFETRLTETGQLVSTVKDVPQLAFEDAELHFFGGERAPLATPARCGAYTTSASFTPWSGNEPVGSTSTFNINSGPHGSPCPGASLPFNPTLTGGATNVNAGVFSPFTLTMNRSDGEQNLQSIEAKLPPGLSGVLSNIELCPEPQANLGECGPNSLIGETTVSVGVGGDPFSVSGGKFYLTGPYNGSGACTIGTSGCAPFGITFEVPAKAGPFDLKRNSANPAGEDACDCVIVRGKIEVDSHTAAITITSNPPGTPDAVPTSIEGIPLEIQHVNAITTRGDFQFNPTNCSKMEVTGTIHSSVGGIDKIGVPFQVTNCRSLAFTPKFKVSTNAKTSKANGASLTTTVTEPAGSLGTQANLAKVKVELPKQLPSRLTTLQKACAAKQFEADPAACPPESKIGYAKVITPLVPVPLEGPAIFVSHGGESFPSLTMVLQGYGVTIDLVGTTFISKSGVTSTTFKTVPDQPFSSFTLTLPTGRFSALTALGNVCKEKLTMPTEFVAQNGAEIHQSTPVTVEGCSSSLSFTHKVKKRTLMLSVYAPAAGKITASGKGLTTASKTAKGRENLTVTLKQKKAGKLKTTVNVTFTPSAGKVRKKQSKALRVQFKK
jgi:hypothetical protein